MHEQGTSRASLMMSTASRSDIPSLHRTASAASVSSQPLSTPSTASKTTTTAPFHLTLMREALSYSHLCEVSPTAFSVGAIIFLPRAASAKLFDALSSTFTSVDGEGLVLSHGYSRQLPGNTHAEANAIHNLVSHFSTLPKDTLVEVIKQTGSKLNQSTWSEAAVKGVLSKSWIYTTLEPCSKRTSGLKDCTSEIIEWGLKRVYMVSVAK